jgi:glycosyl hydrolase family 64 (putative beta-1,3-glucanase)
MAAHSQTSQATGNGSFPVVIENDTHGRWADGQIYVTVLGQATPGNWSYLRPDGTVKHIDHNDANAPGHLEKNGRNYPNMSFTVEQASTVPMQSPRLEGARMYISAGSPMYIPVSDDDKGWGGPDLHNPQDPNADVYFDWYEFTYSYDPGAPVPFGGNTTQVDMFGIPLTARLQQASSGYDQSVGITLTREQNYAQYGETVGPAFQSLAGDYRIVAPRSSSAFAGGGKYGDLIQPAIDAAWQKWATDGFTLTRLNQTFSGRVVEGRLEFTKDGQGPHYLDKPTSADVVQCAGALVPPAPEKVVERELGAELGAAFNRGVSGNTTTWYQPSDYYTHEPSNDYAAFFHRISIDHRAYGFPYDDVNDQSSVKILPNTEPPSAVTIGVGW